MVGSIWKIMTGSMHVDTGQLVYFLAIGLSLFQIIVNPLVLEFR